MAGRELTICELNAENLFISLDYYQGENVELVSEEEWKEFAVPQVRRWQKPIRKLWGLSAALQDIDPDIVMLVEVGGEESLRHFNRLFLGGEYIPYFLESNSPRSIDLAFLVKKSLGFEVKAVSNRHLPIRVEAYQGAYSARLSRDIGELRLLEGGKVKLALFLTHLKSKISTDQDFRGNDVRRAEAIALAGFYEKFRSKHPEVPVVVGGDFNSDLSSSELELIARTDLCDFHDLLATPREERISLVHFDHLGQPQPQVLDYLLLSPHLRDKVVKEKSCTYRYRSFYQIPHPLPSTLEERYRMPSDHYPLVLTLRLK